MKRTIIAIAALANLAGATVATAMAPKAEPRALQELEAEIDAWVDANLREMLARFREQGRS